MTIRERNSLFSLVPITYNVSHSKIDLLESMQQAYFTESFRSLIAFSLHRQYLIFSPDSVPIRFSYVSNIVSFTFHTSVRFEQLATF